MTRNFWKDRRVLITGHTGFKGGWLTIWLQGKGAHVIGYSLPPPTSPSFFEAARVADGITSITNDIRDLAYLKSVLTKYKPEIIFHMAAQSLVRPSYANPVDTYSTNVMGTVHILEAVRQSDHVKVMVNITSDKCYENMEWYWGYRENDPMGGSDPYSSSKGCAELITSAYIRSFFADVKSTPSKVSVASVRAGNVIGGGDWAADRLIPDIIKAVSNNQPAVIRNPDAVRPWQHVLEPLRGYMMLGERLWKDGSLYSGGWNFGPRDDDAKPVSSLADHLTEMWGDGAHWTLDTQTQPHEARYLKLDCSKARSELGWFPKLNLSTALAWTVDWYKAFGNNRNMREFTVAQISRYVNDL